MAPTAVNCSTVDLKDSGEGNPCDKYDSRHWYCQKNLQHGRKSWQEPSKSGPKEFFHHLRLSSQFRWSQQLSRFPPDCLLWAADCKSMMPQNVEGERNGAGRSIKLSRLLPVPAATGENIKRAHNQIASSWWGCRNGYVDTKSYCCLQRGKTLTLFCRSRLNPLCPNQDGQKNTWMTMANKTSDLSFFILLVQNKLDLDDWCGYIARAGLGNLGAPKHDKSWGLCFAVDENIHIRPQMQL